MFNKFCDGFTRLLVIWVLLAVGLGYFLPKSLVIFKPYTEWLFAFTMFGIGSSAGAKTFLSSDCHSQCLVCYVVRNHRFNIGGDLESK